MYAGVEHLGRAMTDLLGAMLVVIEPTRLHLGTVTQIKALAADIGLTRLGLVGNKARNAEEADFLEVAPPGLPILGMLPANLALQEENRLGAAVYDCVPTLRQVTEAIPARLEEFTI